MKTAGAKIMLFSGLSCLLLTVQVFAAPLDGLAKALSKGAQPLKNKKIAVLAFPYHDGRVSSGSSVISERLTTQLVGRKGLRLVERRLIQQLLAEKKLSETGIVDQENLKTIGTILDVDAIVTGTLIDLTNGKTEINARMIRADSGEVLAAGRETIQRTWSDSPVFPKSPVVKKTLMHEQDPESLITEEEVEARPAKPAKSAGKGLKLSNESFPAGRRVYNGNEPAPKENKGTSASSSYQEDDDYYDQPYRTSNTGTAYAPPQRSNTNSGYDNTGSTIRHPTPIGVIRSERTYPTYKPYKKKKTSY